jgi:hypothetical protein
MTYLIAGLVIFFATHSVRIFAEDWRAAGIQRMGERPWKAIYSLVSIAGFVLIVWGYGLARQAPVDLWSPPAWTRHVTALLTLPAFILVAAAYVRGNRIKAAVGHPMVLGVKTWALAHLLSNGRLADVLLFGGFLVWAILCGTLDNFLRPLLIRRGADLPLLLIFAGVMGGLIAFGVIGLFIGPVVLAVAYTLLVEWVTEGDPHAERQNG